MYSPGPRCSRFGPRSFQVSFFLYVKPGQWRLTQSRDLGFLYKRETIIVYRKCMWVNTTLRQAPTNRLYEDILRACLMLTDYGEFMKFRRQPSVCGYLLQIEYRITYRIGPGITIACRTQRPLHNNILRSG